MPAIYAGLTIGQKAGTLLSLSSNIFWQVGSPQPDTYAIQNLDPNPVQIVTAANADYNGTYNLSTVPAGTWNDVADGTVYSTPITGTTPPGVHDQSNVNPQSSDPTRNLQTWDAWLGGPGTVAGALALLQQNPALTDSSLLPYIQTGFAPTNAAYQGTGLGGTDIAAVPANVSACHGSLPIAHACNGYGPNCQPVLVCITQRRQRRDSILAFAGFDGRHWFHRGAWRSKRRHGQGFAFETGHLAFRPRLTAWGHGPGLPRFGATGIRRFRSNPLLDDAGLAVGSDLNS